MNMLQACETLRDAFMEGSINDEDIDEILALAPLHWMQREAVRDYVLNGFYEVQVH